jgi:murein DD-endopeptidase MepM/ murein hydrolase activator NlpD
MRKSACLLPVLMTGIAIAVLAAGPVTAASAAAPAANGDRITRAELDQASFCAITRKPPCGIKTAVARGLFITGLEPRFAPGVKCAPIDQPYAMNYTFKRNRENYHAAIDMPEPFGTPVHAAAAGTVVGIYRGRGHLGIHVILRDTPEETGLPIYIYTLYAHFETMPKLSVGEHVSEGEVLGPTGNSGAKRAHKKGHGSRARRPAVHFGVYYSASPQYAVLKHIVIPPDAYWMDPVALYRGKPPFDSAALKALAASEKKVFIPYMLADGSIHPTGSKIIWPYACERR